MSYVEDMSQAIQTSFYPSLLYPQSPGTRWRFSARLDLIFLEEAHSVSLKHSTLELQVLWPQNQLGADQVFYAYPSSMGIFYNT